ncbi:hypothetical protein LTR17_020630 [Elasticomyces elasticus]|nr:hypothetical protein LTR17_020630 [Elasticomyces elasticus]
MATSDDAKLAQYDSLVAENLVRRQNSSSERAFDADSIAASKTANSEAQHASTGRESVMSLASAGETPGSHEQHVGSDLDSIIDAKSINASSDGQDVIPSVHASYATSTVEQGVSTDPRIGGDLSSALLQIVNTEGSAVASWELGDLATPLLAPTMVSETEGERIEREMEATALDEEEKERIYRETKRQQQEARAAAEASRRQLRSILEERAAEHLEEKREKNTKVGKVTGTVEDMLRATISPGDGARSSK